MEINKKLADFSIEEWKELFGVCKDVSKYLFDITTDKNSLTLEQASYVSITGMYMYLEFLWDRFKLDHDKLPAYIFNIVNNLYKQSNEVQKQSSESPSETSSMGEAE